MENYHGECRLLLSRPVVHLSSPHPDDQLFLLVILSQGLFPQPDVRQLDRIRSLLTRHPCNPTDVPLWSDALCWQDPGLSLHRVKNRQLQRLRRDQLPPH